MARASNLKINVTSDSTQAQADVKKVEETTTSTFSKLGSTLPGIAAGLGLAIAGGLTAAFDAAMDQAKIRAKLAGQLGATPEEAKRFGKAAGQLYASGFAEDAQQGADAIRAVIGAGLVDRGATVQEINKIGGAVSALANTFDEDLGGVTRSVATLMRTHLASSAQEGLDLVTVAFQKFGPQADDLLDTVTEYSVQFQKLGLSGAQALGILNQGLAGGARNADLVADGLKEFSLLAVSGSPAVAKAFKDVGLNADQARKDLLAGGDAARGVLQTVLDGLRTMQPGIQRNDDALALFGTKWEDLGTSLLSLDPSHATDALGQVTGAAQALGDTVQNSPGQAWERFTRSLEQGFVEIFINKVLPVLQEGADFLRDALAPAVDRAQQLWAKWGPELEEFAKMVRDELVPVLENGMAKTLDQVDRALTTVSDALADAGVDTEDLKDAASLLADLLGGAVIGTLMGVGKAAEFGADGIAFLVKAVDAAVDALKELWSWAEKAKDAVDFLWNNGSLNSQFRPGTRSSAAAGLMAGPTGRSAATLTAAASLPVSLAPSLAVHVTIDGQQLQGRITNTVRGAINADGARYIAGGWA